MTNRQESAIQWSREEIIWLAGLFEGEGCISHAGPAPSNPRKDQWTLRIASTDEDVVRSVMHAAQLGHVTGPVVRDHKPVWIWACTARDDIYALLVAMWPWLHARRRGRASECLLAIGSRRTGQRRIAECRNSHDVTLPSALIEHWSHPRCRACAEDAVARKREQRLLKRQAVML